MELRVAGVLVQNGKVLLARHLKRGEDYWVLPGGHVEEGETLSEALAREMAEETSLAVTVGDLLFAHDFLSEKPARHVVNVTFSVTATSPAPPYVQSHKVLKEVRFFTADELKHIDLRPEIVAELTQCLAGRFPLQRYLGPR